MKKSEQSRHGAKPYCAATKMTASIKPRPLLWRAPIYLHPQDQWPCVLFPGSLQYRQKAYHAGTNNLLFPSSKYIKGIPSSGFKEKHHFDLPHTGHHLPVEPDREQHLPRRRHHHHHHHHHHKQSPQPEQMQQKTQCVCPSLQHLDSPRHRNSSKEKKTRKCTFQGLEEVHFLPSISSSHKHSSIQQQNEHCHSRRTCHHHEPTMVNHYCSRCGLPRNLPQMFTIRRYNPGYQQFPYRH
ncbi:uncharacterized transmembrane protein DDB_G0281039-like [Monodelphis domestica]|uniref:uncharacterized transmembrane protein DDB_G0281039-like n=1 Tax=Monodelphis domestica TaxID=13616 RepID=UPI0004431B3A|nr:uncharacterized transmembrane protein DDB_G0281039-like [Monodelphis domestica]